MTLEYRGLGRGFVPKWKGNSSDDPAVVNEAGVKMAQSPEAATIEDAEPTPAELARAQRTLRDEVADRIRRV